VTRDELGVRDFVAAPLWADDSVTGAIMVAGRLGSISTFGEEDCRLFETLANHASIAIENSRLLQQLRQEAEDRRYEALHDALTGLPNRALFTQEVDAVMATGAASAVLLMDLDRFKEVNDTLGHHTGDILLGEVARRLVGSLPTGTTAARLGGDEFAILLPGVDNPTAERVADGVLEAFQWPCVLDDLSIEIGASIGIALAPFHGTDAATLLQRADVAMYEAKFSRRGRQTYSAERDTYSPRRLALLAELRQAIDDGQILVYFQPKARLADGHVLGAEALVRWQHPVHGLLPPDEFVPAVEHTGLISPLTTYVLRNALQQCARWRAAGQDLGVAVNIAVRSLLDVELPQAVNDLLAETKVPADRLTLEITESGIMADPKRAIAVLEGLAGSGIRLSVDDFGTGYSSLTYLQRLPVHEVKVDKSFVFGVATDTADTVIVQSIVDLGHNLGLKVVAEGVEDEATWRRLCDMSCDVAQGYYLSKPVTSAALGTWLDERQLGRLTLAVPDLSSGSVLPGRPTGAARASATS
jgi:diguanylate cyclase (GGDEF)-like protein